MQVTATFWFENNRNEHLDCKSLRLDLRPTKDRERILYTILKHFNNNIGIQMNWSNDSLFTLFNLPFISEHLSVRVLDIYAKPIMLKK